MPNEHWQIGDCRVDGLNQTLHHADGRSTHLPPKHLGVLLLLAEHAGNCVTRHTLLDTVWSRSLVQDEVLTRIIADLRRLLDDGGRPPRYIETVPKRGYRLCASARPIEPRALPKPRPVAEFESALASDATPTLLSSVASNTAAASAPAPRSAPVDIADVPAELADSPFIATRTTTAGSTAPALPASSTLARRGLLALLVMLPALLLIGGERDAVAPTRARLADWTLRLAQAQPMLTEPALESSPRWMPDGLSLLYARRESLAATRTQLLRFHLADRRREILVDAGQNDRCPTPSPDGRSLAWLRLRGAECTVWMQPLSGGPALPLGACALAGGQTSCPEFSTDGAALIVSQRHADGDFGLVALALDGSAPRRLTRTPAGAGEDAHPRRSPDGRWLAFERRGDYPTSRLMRLDLQAEAPPQALQAHVEDNFGFTWDGDGRRLLLASNAIDFLGLLSWPVDGAAPQLLGARGARQPDISVHGALAFEQTRYRSNLWRATRGSSVLQRLTATEKHDADPQFSPALPQLAFVSNRSGQESVWLRALDGAEEHSLPLPVESRWLRPHWSADGQPLVLSRVDDEGYGVCLYRLLADKLDCPPALRNFAAGALLPDGDLLVADQPGAGARLYRYRPADRELRPLLPNPVKQWQLHGSRLGYRDLQGQLWLHSLEGAGEPRQVAAEASALPWSLNAQALYLATANQGELRVRRHPLTAEATSAVADFPPLPAFTQSFAVSDDDATLVLARLDDYRVDIAVTAPALPRR